MGCCCSCRTTRGSRRRRCLRGGTWWAIVTACRLHSELYVRAAVASSAGSEVVVELPSQAKVDLTLVAYSGTAPEPVGQWAAETESETTASHVAPALQVDTTSSWVMSYWVDKVSSGDGSWKARRCRRVRRWPGLVAGSCPRWRWTTVHRLPRERGRPRPPWPISPPAQQSCEHRTPH